MQAPHPDIAPEIKQKSHRSSLLPRKPEEIGSLMIQKILGVNYKIFFFSVERRIYQRKKITNTLSTTKFLYWLQYSQIAQHETWWALWNFFPFIPVPKGEFPPSAYIPCSPFLMQAFQRVLQMHSLRFSSGRRARACRGNRMSSGPCDLRLLCQKMLI